jgi:rSAM/selenodomain-associated transferase 2
MVSIIIPTYNEAENIGRLVNYIIKHCRKGSYELIVSDGGSADRTVEIAQHSGARAVVSPNKGRAAQMNYAASIAIGEILYFVHADTFPPPSCIDEIEAAVVNGYDLGRFRTAFDSSKIILNINAFFTRFDWFICYGGDQTLFITKKLFNTVKGFKEQMQIMEDYELVARARKFGCYKIFKKAALVSARKYDTNSWFKVQWANRTIVRMYHSGASQQDMVNKYREMLVYR